MIKSIKTKISKNFYKNVIIFAGAGMSVDSGIPDYRSDNGFWNDNKASKEMDLDFEELSKPTWFKTRPDMAWQAFGYMINTFAKSKPHNGYLLLKKHLKNLNYFIVTSNIDNQFKKAGFDTEKIFEIHGNAFKTQCTKSGGFFFDTECKLIGDLSKYEAESIPMCECGSIARPNVMLFGDSEWNSGPYDEKEKEYHRWINETRGKTLILEIGAGDSIPTIRNNSQFAFKNLDADFVRINLEETKVPEHGEMFVESAEKGLEYLFS